jgi:hypothetical protein
MGESTRLRLAGLIQAAKSDQGSSPGAAMNRGPSAAYVGGYQGGLGGTWGKASTGREAGQPRSNPEPVAAGKRYVVQRSPH